MNAGNKGLANLGNTCYMNAALQCLSHLLEFHPKNDRYTNQNKNRDDIYSEWLQLQLELWSNDKSNTVVPTNIIKKFTQGCIETDKEFYHFNQNDTEEFIEFFMDLLHRSMKRSVRFTFDGTIETQMDKLALKSSKRWSDYFKNDYSYIIETFYSQLLSITSCTKCDYMATNFDPTMVLSLEIPNQANSLYDCLDSYTQMIILDCENSWKCEKCKNMVEPEKKMVMWKQSPVIIILLKRYSKTNKKDNFIKFPINLDISKYSLNYNKVSSDYKLSGICIQSGSLRGGHYYAMCYNELDKKWREYNDTTVRLVDEYELLKQKPYCLFYRRN
jgi:ubiquitin carboxyl-terminal hydrolase 8